MRSELSREIAKSWTGEPAAVAEREAAVVGDRRRIARLGPTIPEGCSTRQPASGEPSSRSRRPAQRLARQREVQLRWRALDRRDGLGVGLVKRRGRDHDQRDTAGYALQAERAVVARERRRERVHVLDAADAERGPADRATRLVAHALDDRRAAFAAELAHPRAQERDRAVRRVAAVLAEDRPAHDELRRRDDEAHARVAVAEELAVSRSRPLSSAERNTPCRALSAQGPPTQGSRGQATLLVAHRDAREAIGHRPVDVTDREDLRAGDRGLALVDDEPVDRERALGRELDDALAARLDPHPATIEFVESHVDIARRELGQDEVPVVAGRLAPQHAVLRRAADHAGESGSGWPSSAWRALTRREPVCGLGASGAGASRGAAVAAGASATGLSIARARGLGAGGVAVAGPSRAAGAPADSGAASPAANRTAIASSTSTAEREPQFFGFAKNVTALLEMSRS